MIRVLPVLLLLSLLAPTTPYPEWAYYDCDTPVAMTVLTWYDPPQGVGAMKDGILYVWGSGSTYTLHYDGWYQDIEGKIVHEWYAYYVRPDEAYYLNAYVRNVNGAYFWVNERFSPPCFLNYVYLPYIAKRGR